MAALAAKLMAGELADERWAVAIGVAALAAAAGGLATLSEMSALQRLPATRVAPIVLAFQIVVPVVVVAVVGGEDWGATPLGGAVLVVGLVAVVAGAVLLAASQPASKFIVPPSPGSPRRLGSRVNERSGSGRWASARRSAASSSARVVATSASPKRPYAWLLARMWPRPQP